jgi:hypothetical protein
MFLDFVHHLHFEDKTNFRNWIFFHQVRRWGGTYSETAELTHWTLDRSSCWNNAFFWNTRQCRSWDSSVSIVMGYGLEFESRQRQYFSMLHNVSTGSGAHLVSYPVGTGGDFPRSKAAGVVTLTTHLHPVPRSRKRGSIFPLPYMPSWRSA